MTTPGQIISNKVTGEKLKYLQTAKETGGQFTKFELWISPKGFIPVRHLHPQQSETIEVVSGIFKVECDGDIHYLKPGEKFTIEKGKPHQWWNESESETIQVIFTIAPANNFEEMQQQIFGICNAKGKLDFLQIMVMAKRYDMVIAGPPVLVQMLMRALLSPIGRLMGYRESYPEYSYD